MVQGSTCGGVPVGESPCQGPGHPVVFIYVDALAGVHLQLTASPGISLLAFPGCQSDQTNECTLGPHFNPSGPGLLFGLTRNDMCCGDFTVGVIGI
jgi:hypothetical protein